MRIVNNRRTRSRILLFTPFLLVLYVGCAGFGGRPGWITSPPRDTSDAVYFVSAGSDATGNTGEAETQASRALASDIAKYIGVNISSDTTVEAKATFDSYQAQVTETIRERSSAQISGFRVVDRYIETTSSGGVFIYLLGEYNRRDLENEKVRFEQLFAEREEAMSVPEQEGLSRMSAGEYVLAAESFLAAAAAALTSDVDNSLIRFERVIATTRESLGSVRFEKQSDMLSTIVNTPFLEPFTVAITGKNRTPLANVPVLITYRVAQGNGRLSVRSDSALSDADGIVRFEHPVPRTAGEREVVISLDLRSSLEPLDSARGKARDLLNSVDDIVNSKRVTFRYQVVSESAAVPTAILVSEFASNGDELDSTRMAVELAGVLTSGGYNVAVISTDGGIESERVGSRFERRINGTARIVDVSASDGSFLVRVEAAVSVIEIQSGRTLYATSTSRTVRSRNKTGSEEAALTAIGKVIGEMIYAEMP